jgi:LPS-assembly protein
VTWTSGAFAQRLGEQSASIQGINIQADSMDRDTENETVDLVGNVQLVYQDQHLRCDRAHINLRAKSIDASGHVFLTTPKANLSGARVIMDYETNTGLILDGYVQSGNVLFEGSLIHKLSEVDYLADDARYTTCTTCPEAWSFTGSKIRAEIGGYAYIKNSVMRFASIPVLWLPYLAVPLKTDRQTGLLTPTIGILGDEGWTYSQGLFWAISRSQDATINLTNYEFRGLKSLVNYRYVLSENSEGELDLGYLKDRLFGDQARVNAFRGSGNSEHGEAVDRWLIKYNHYYELPDGFTQRAQINYASDLQYPKDFPRETLNSGDSAMENRVSLTKNTEHQHWSVDTSYYKNLLQSDPLASNNDSVHRLPEIRFSQTQTRLGDSEFMASIDIDYVNFARSGFAWDDMNKTYDPTGNSTDRHVEAKGNSADCFTVNWEKNPECYRLRDGRYDSNKDLIRTGQRLDIQPSVYRAFKFKNLELTPRVSYRETQYTFPVGDDAGNDTHNIRRYLRTDVAARTTFSRIYGDFSSLQSERIKHELQPEVSFTTIPWLDHPQNSFFGENNGEDTQFLQSSFISDADLNGPTGLQFDYNDRLYDRKKATFGVTNKLTRKYWENGSPVYLQFLFWRLAQSYDAFQAERNPKSEPLSSLDSDLKITLKYLQLYQTSNYYPYQKVTNTSTRVRVNNDAGESFQVQHTLTNQILPGQEADSSLVVEGYIFTAQKSFSWVDLIGKAAYGMRPAKVLTAWGYGAQIKFPGDCFYLVLSHYKPSLDKKANIEASVNFAWDGNPRPGLTETMLSSFGF